MKKEDLERVLELRDSGEDAVLVKRSLGWRLVLMVGVIVLLGATLAPMGILGLFYYFGVQIYYGGGGSEGSIVGSFLMVCALVGFVSVGAKNPRIFRWVFWVLLVVGVLNVSGCAVMLDALGKIH